MTNPSFVEPAPPAPAAADVHLREETVFSTRMPRATARRLRHYCFNNQLFIQDVVTSLVETWLDEQGAGPAPKEKIR